MASIDFGTGPGTGDKLPDALKKLQSRLDGLENNDVSSQINSLDARLDVIEASTTTLKVVYKEFSGNQGDTTFTSDVDFYINSAEVYLNGLLLSPLDFSFTGLRTLVLTSPLKGSGSVAVHSTNVLKVSQ